MTENLAKYLPSALRMGANDDSTFAELEKKIVTQAKSPDLNKSSFLIDTKFLLRLDEVI